MLVAFGPVADSRNFPFRNRTIRYDGARHLGFTVRVLP